MNGRVPFTSGGDAKRYLLEVLALCILLTLAISFMFFGAQLLAIAFFLAAGAVMLVRLRPRASHLDLDAKWPVMDWNIRAREMSVLRVRYVIAALRDRHVPIAAVIAGTTLLLAVLAISLWINRHFFF